MVVSRVLFTIPFQFCWFFVDIGLLTDDWRTMKVSGFTICLSHQAKSDTSKHTNPTWEHTMGTFALI